jgi:inward rectifier potassium channel
VETLATVGYGDMHPANIYTHVISTLEIFVGMMGIALTTGLTFARFSRPRARIITSRHPVVSNHNGQPALMIRAANARKSMIVQASANLYVLIQQTTSEGKSMRSLLDLKLMRNVHPMFILSWTLIHIIDESSPLYGHDAQSLQDMRASIVLTINGADEITTQTMRSRHVYSHQDLRWDHAFEDMLSIDDKGHEHVDYERLHAIRPID